MDDLVVKTKQGGLKGRVVNNVRGGEYYSFQGIPYAKPPLGELRFKVTVPQAPQPPEPWEGIRDATKHQSQSLQMNAFQQASATVAGSEDCLYLNVYTPQKPVLQKKKLKPVMVWIHGGAFVYGSGDETQYGPDYLLKEDVIVVTINYRLGLLGFLKIDDPALGVPGNAALKDMVMALKWVQENITQFGGDCHNVTIFGESAGGISVHLLVLSPLSKGLFQRAIIQSGSALNVWALLWPELDYIPELSKALNINETDNAKILEKLRELPAEELLQVQNKFDNSLVKRRWFIPVVEKASKEPAFLPDQPLNIIRSGKYNKVPLIFGYTSREGLIMAMEMEKLLSKTIEDLIPHNLNIPKGSDESKRIVEEIQKFYFGGKEISPENIGDLFLFFSDTHFLNGMYNSIREHTRNLSRDIYIYRFSVDGKLNFVKKLFNIKEPGTSHGDELLYQFRTQAPVEIGPNSIEDLTIKRLANLWANFAKFGNPNPKASSDLVNVKWQPIKKNEYRYLEIGENLAVGVNPDIITTARSSLKTVKFASTMGDLIVKVKQGELKGSVVNNTRGGEYYSFKGIPYAKPPLGELRFKAPQPPEPWEGIKDATNHQGISLQPDRILGGSIIHGSEDCLYLNVYTPEKPLVLKKNPKPVMVWIHGGVFTWGSGDEERHGPDYLLKEDVIVVTLNYRLGILGFLRIDDPTLDVPGNAALKDMVMALKWVQENIAQFGGDPHNVTIFGLSAGGASVGLLLLSPMAKGLFHRAIMQSGGSLNMWAVLYPEVDYKPQLLKLFNIHETDNAKILQKLREIPAEELIRAQLEIDSSLFQQRRLVPVVEKTSKEPAFLMDHPLNIIRSGKYNKVPLIFGYSSREGMLMTRELKTILSKTTEDFIPYNLNVTKGSNESKRIAEDIHKFYLGGKEVSRENLEDLLLLLSDTFFIYGIQDTAREHAKSLSHDVYLYRFSVDGKLNFWKRILNIKESGTCHGDELSYLFRNQLLPVEVSADSIEDLTIRRITKLWANFAKSGNPNPKETSDLISVKWQPIKINEFHYLEIGENLTVGVNPDIVRMKFWDKY